jgi:hypothetical protein
MRGEASTRRFHANDLIVLCRPPRLASSGAMEPAFVRRLLSGWRLCSFRREPDVSLYKRGHAHRSDCCRHYAGSYPSNDPESAGDCKSPHDLFIGGHNHHERHDRDRGYALIPTTVSSSMRLMAIRTGLRGMGDIGLVGGGVAYRVTPDLQLDRGINFGVTAASARNAPVRGPVRHASETLRPLVIASSQVSRAAAEPSASRRREVGRGCNASSASALRRPQSYSNSIGSTKRDPRAVSR